MQILPNPARSEEAVTVNFAVICYSSVFFSISEKEKYLDE